MRPSKEELIQSLISDGYLKSKYLIASFRAIDRRDFVPKTLWPEAYENHPLPIGEGQTISQPLTVAFMLELLEPEPGEKILEVGAGSGWQAALLAYVVSQSKKAGKVVAIERIKELKQMAKRNVSKYGFLEKGALKIILGDGSLGYAPDAPYDKIIAAAAGREVPEAWKKQLKTGGRIVAPVGQSIVVLDKISEKEFREKEHFGFSFVPLVRD